MFEPVYCSYPLKYHKYANQCYTYRDNITKIQRGDNITNIYRDKF
jgi:hypothetical protein